MSRQVRPGGPQYAGQGPSSQPQAPSTSSSHETAPIGDEYTAVSEFVLESGGIEVARICKSFEGIRTPTYDYEQGILTTGNIVRSIGPVAEPYSVGQLQVEYHNTNRQYSILKDGNRFRGRKQYFRFGLIANGLAAMRQLFVGTVEDWRIRNGRASFSLKDSGIDRFRKPLRETLGTINLETFPDLPSGRPEVLINVIYGDISTNGGNMIGAGPIPCYLIDADAAGKWRYLVAGHVCKSVDTVYIYGIATGAGFTVTTATYDGRLMQVIDFDADPRDTTRPNETEVTVLAKGTTDNNSPGGDLITNPVEQLEHFLLNYGGWSASELDSALFDEAIAAANANEFMGAAAPYKGCFLITGSTAQRVLDVLNEMTRSWLCYVWMTTENKVGTFLLTLTETQNPPAADFDVADGDSILRNSFVVWGNRDVYSHVDYQYVYNWTLERYASTASGTSSVPVLRSFPLDHETKTFPVDHSTRTFPVYYDAGSTADLHLGDEDTPDAPSKLVSLPYVADPNTATSIVHVYALLAAEGVEFCQFDLPAEYLLNTAADLNRYCSVTHWQGISSAGGYANEIFRIVKTEASIMPKQKGLRCTAIKVV